MLRPLALLLALLPLACDQPSQWDYELRDVVAERDEGGQIVVRGTIVNEGPDDQGTGVCIRCEWFEDRPVAGPQVTPGAEPGEVDTRLVDAREHCVYGQLEDGESTTFAITMAGARPSGAAQRLLVTSMSASDGAYAAPLSLPVPP